VFQGESRFLVAKATRNDVVASKPERTKIMSNLIIEKLLSKTKRTDLPEFAPGDTIRVQVKIKEGDKERIQAFEGVVIARSRGPQASFTVRKMSFGQGVERIFPESSGVIDKVELVRSSKVRRAKLYYLRNLRGKAARLKDVDREHASAATT
jgi:large subunit ribosomal protein L19